MRFVLAALIISTWSVAADTQIHRCTMEDGTVAFQETPCVEAAETDDSVQDEGSDSQTVPSDDGFFDFVNPYDEPASPETPPETPSPEPVSQDRSECEQMTRDAIDAIDLEMRETTYSQEQGEAYLAELLTLTRQLRACKQL